MPSYLEEGTQCEEHYEQSSPSALLKSHKLVFNKQGCWANSLKYAPGLGKPNL